MLRRRQRQRAIPDRCGEVVGLLVGGVVGLVGWKWADEN
jgi:hypothetical protein